jgi:malonate decarboxylase beta subunit
VRIRSYFEATARQRIDGIVDEGSFVELLPPSARVVSPHLSAFDLPAAFDDGVVVGRAALEGRSILIAAQEGGFMGGSVGEVHGAKLAGLLRRALSDRPAAVLLLVESGGVRLQEANAGLIAVSEIIRGILTARAAGIAVIAGVGGAFGCFGGMGIAAACCDAIVMSEEGRLGLSGPEVIETAHGVEEFDSRDRALVWRTVGGKHRFLLGDCSRLVEGHLPGFRVALSAAIGDVSAMTLESVEREQATLERRLATFGDVGDGRDVWRSLGWPTPDDIPLMPIDVFVAEVASRARRVGSDEESVR